MSVAVRWPHGFFVPLERRGQPSSTTSWPSSSSSRKLARVSLAQNRTRCAWFGSTNGSAGAGGVRDWPRDNRPGVGGDFLPCRRRARQPQPRKRNTRRAVRAVREKIPRRAARRAGAPAETARVGWRPCLKQIMARRSKAVQAEKSRGPRDPRDNPRPDLTRQPESCAVSLPRILAA